jgi:hypothetical protein
MRHDIFLRIMQCGVRVRVAGELAYGGTVITPQIEAEVSGAVALIGPNLTGKSLLLQCLYSRARDKKVGRPLQPPPGLECDAERDDYLAIFVDAYRVVSQLYEAALHDRLEVIKEHADVLSLDPSREEDVRRAAHSIKNVASEMEWVLGDLKFVLDVKEQADDHLVAEAVGTFRELLNEWLDRAGKARNEFREIFDDFFPVVLSATKAGFTWRDLKAGASGLGLRQLSTGFSPVLVALYAMYAYGVPRETYLLVEEPEAHAHPLMAFFLGAYLRRLARQSGGRLNVVVSTHSRDFLEGFWEGGFTKAYVVRRRVEDRRVVLEIAGQWQGEGYVPGFSDPAIYRLLGLR